MPSKARKMIEDNKKGKSLSSQTVAAEYSSETASDKIRKFLGVEKDAKVKKVKKDHNIS